MTRRAAGAAEPPRSRGRRAGGTERARPGRTAPTTARRGRSPLDQQALGVDAKSLIQPFFVSDAAFTTAWDQTGTVPLLCAKKVPGDVEVTGSAAVSGDTTTLNMVTWPSWHPDDPGQEASKFTLTLDLASMKISGITCTK